MVKWILASVVVLVAGWLLAVKLVNRQGNEGRLETTDTLLARQSLLDSLRRDSIFRDSLHRDSLAIDSVRMGLKIDTLVKQPLNLPKGPIQTKGVQPRQLLAFAKNLIGVPYLYGSTDPAKGFDCSGFITYVFNHFGIAVPRSSIDFTNVGTEVSAAAARAGDLILFTGTDSTEHFVGHMGIVVENTDTLRFIHSTSGKANGVTITPLNAYYQKRYVKTIRVFP